MILDVILFYGAAIVALASGISVISRRNPINSAFSLIVTMCSLAVMFAMLGSGFIAVLQVVVYAGAIMVLFLFTVMLLNVPREDAAEWDRAHPLYRPMAVRIGGGLAILLALELGWALSRTAGLGGGVADEHPAVSSVAELGRVLFTDYMFAFEVTSILIIVAMVGAVVLAKKREE